MHSCACIAGSGKQQVIVLQAAAASVRTCAEAHRVRFELVAEVPLSLCLLCHDNEACAGHAVRSQPAAQCSTSAMSQAGSPLTWLRTEHQVKAAAELPARSSMHASCSQFAAGNSQRHLLTRCALVEAMHDAWPQQRRLRGRQAIKSVMPQAVVRLFVGLVCAAAFVEGSRRSCMLPNR